MTIVPIYNRILVPHANIYFPSDAFKQLAGKEAQEGEKVIFLISRDSEGWQDLNDESFFPIGVSGMVTEVNSNGYCVVKTADRVNIDSIIVRGMFRVEISITRRPEIEDIDPEMEEKRLQRMKSKILEFLSQTQWGTMARSYVNQQESIGEIASVMSNWFTNTVEEKYAVLAEDSLARRTDIMESMIYEYLEIAKLTGEAENKQEEDNQKAYRKQAIQRQMEYLQKQLDEMDPENVSDVRKFEVRIEESGMNETAEKEARKVLNRLKQEGQNSPESGLLYDYLDFVTSLSWKKEPAQHIDLDEAERVLEEDHFGLEKVKHRIVQQIAVMDLQEKQSGSILLFVGAPGTGKTSIGRSIAAATKREYVRVSLGGVRDEADIRGHRRTYIGAMPGRIMDGIQKSGVSNPVMVLDEVDKLSMSYNGDPASALLEVLDPEQNSTFTDHYMNVPYDLSDVLFICTANTVSTIPEPLLNRMEVIQFPGYTATDKYQIAVRHLLPKAMKAMGIREDNLEIPEETMRTIISDYTAEAGVRGLKKRIDTLCRVAAVEIVKNSPDKPSGKPEAAEAPETFGKKALPAPEQASEEAGRAGAEGSAEAGNIVGTKVDETGNEINTGAEGHDESGFARGHKVVVRPEDLREYLDTRPITHDHILAEKKPGVVTGLAWTQAGGEILFIETLFTRGSGKTIVTGQLGDVMKESVQIAVSLVKSMYPEEAERFEKNDLHIHIPAGAVPKDGPSAGITLTTAITSLVTGRAVSPEFAMTGEVSLRGVVTPIGGLPEKLMAAQRAGIKTVFIPKENVDDLKDVAEEVKEKLEILPVGTVNDVLTKTGLLDA